MFELGKRSECFGMELLQPLTIRYPGVKSLNMMPAVPKDHAVVCGFDQGLGERMIVCESLEDMQELQSKYSQGSALQINWYTGPDPGFISVLP